MVRCKVVILIIFFLFSKSVRFITNLITNVLTIDNELKTNRLQI